MYVYNYIEGIMFVQFQWYKLCSKSWHILCALYI